MSIQARLLVAIITLQYTHRNRNVSFSPLSRLCTCSLVVAVSRRNDAEKERRNRFLCMHNIHTVFALAILYNVQTTRYVYLFIRMSMATNLYGSYNICDCVLVLVHHIQYPMALGVITFLFLFYGSEIEKQNQGLFWCSKAFNMPKLSDR